MPKKLTKALRGKRRWIGCRCPGFKLRKDLEDYLSEMPVKLYDFEDGKCILVVRLEDYNSVRLNLAKGRIVSETTSGKIRLVRDRMGFSRTPRKR